MDRLRSDLGYAWRRLWRTPGFTLIAVLTLALGIGANTALFSLVNGLLFKSLPIPNLDRIATLTEVDPSTGLVFNSLTDDERRAIDGAKSGLFDQFTLADPLIGALAGGGRSDVVTGELVSGNYFDVMGVRPRAGRLLEPIDDREDSPETPIVISERLWRRWFDAAPSAIGTAVTMADHPLVIVGVVPDEFKGTWLPTIVAADMWAPLHAQSQLTTVQGAAVRTSHRTFALLHPGVSLSQSNAMVEAIGHQFFVSDTQYLAALPGRAGIMNPEFEHYGLLLGSAVLGLSGLVFLIACANLTNLLLARGAARAGEMAIRIATGAGRSRIFQLFLTETALLTALAGVVGLAVTVATTRLMTTIPLPVLDGITIRFDPSPDLRVFGYAFSIAALAAFAVGLAPAWRAARTEPLRVLASGGASGGATSRGHRLRTLLVASQVAMSIVLLVGAGLYVRSATAAMRYDPGYDVTRAAIASVDLRYTKTDEARGRQIFRRMLEAADETAGVQDAALVTSVPGAIRAPTGLYMLPEGWTPPTGVHGVSGYFAQYSAVSPGYFDTVGIRLLRGRDFNATDLQTSTPVVIISERAAARFWPHQDPIGKRLQIRGSGPWLEIIGIAANTEGGWNGDTPRPFLYLPLEQNYGPTVSVVVRSTSNPASMIEPLRAAIRRADPNVAITAASTLADYVGLILVPIRITAIVLGSLGVLGFAIAVLGLYGVIAYVVSQRTREFGIRKALGASAPQLYAVVLRQGVRMLVMGVVPGVVIAFAGAGFLRHLLYGVEPYDPLTFTAVPLVLMLVGLAASVIPARRAARVDPNAALREL
jgi:macrolide transport system ATP-binding/permease protein